MMVVRLDKLIYRNRILAVYKSEKGRYKFVKIKQKDYSVILPFLGADRIIVERQYRVVLGKELYEIPAGHIRYGESPIAAARRELAEETGYVAGSIKPMFRAYMEPGSMTSKATFVIATGLRKGPTHPDRDERIGTKVVSLDQAVRLIKSNKITDGKTIAAILYYKYFHR